MEAGLSKSQQYDIIDSAMLAESNPDLLEKEISYAVTEALNESWEHYYAGRRVEGGQPWLTRRIKDVLGELGASKGMRITSYGDEGEWLYDMVWYKEDSNGYLIEIPLVLESEMSDCRVAGLKYDFEKLLVANASYRVFICYYKVSKDLPTMESLFIFFSKMVRACTMLPVGARFLVLVCDFSSKKLYPFSIVKDE